MDFKERLQTAVTTRDPRAWEDVQTMYDNVVVDLETINKLAKQFAKDLGICRKSRLEAMHKYNALLDDTKIVTNRKHIMAIENAISVLKLLHNPKNRGIIGENKAQEYIEVAIKQLKEIEL